MTHTLIDRVGFAVPPAAIAGLPKNSPVLLGFSGGADSVALAHVLISHAEKYGFPLTLLHVNHGIRGEEAARDEAFCRKFAKERGLELLVYSADVPALAKERGQGLEECAREVRYAFFEQVMRERNIPLAVTAHHADDQLETLLFRLSRGTTLRGLCGILAVRPFAGGYVVRPFLPYSRKQILEYCHENGLAYVTDSTNYDIDYARNRLRVEVTPHLEALFDDPQKRVAELTRQLQEDESFLNALTLEFLLQNLTSKGISLAALRGAAPSVRRRALSAYAQNICEVSAEGVHIRAMLSLVETGEGEITLPHGYCAAVEDAHLRILPPPKEPFGGSVPLSFGKTAIPGSDFQILVEASENTTKIHNLYTATSINLHLSCDIMGNDLHWRTRREGDVFFFRGMHRKLRKLYLEKNIPPRLREQMPLLCDSEGIVYAPWIGVRDGYRAGDEPVAVTVTVLIKKELF